MIVMAVVGLVMGGIVGVIRVQRRREHFRSLAGRYTALESLYLRRAQRLAAVIKLTTQELDVFEKHPPVSGPSVVEQARSLLREDQDSQAACARTLAHYARLKGKYEYAARYPWLSVEPDPPKPE